LPLEAAAPSDIDHQSDLAHFGAIPDLGARLRLLTVEHPDPDTVGALYPSLGVKGPPAVTKGLTLRYRALIDIPAGMRDMT
jgi:hypothetical protein